LFDLGSNNVEFDSHLEQLVLLFLMHHNQPHVLTGPELVPRFEALFGLFLLFNGLLRGSLGLHLKLLRLHSELEYSVHDRLFARLLLLQSLLLFELLRFYRNR
jgi:hypothetical protein